jgi:hypothetical protein
MARGQRPTSSSSRRSPRLVLRPKPLFATTEGLTWLVAGWTPDVIEKLVARGIFKLNVHYVQPFGDQRLFIVREIEAAIERELAAGPANVVEDQPAAPVVEVTRPIIPMAKGRVLDATDPKAAAEEWMQSRQSRGEAALPVPRGGTAEVTRHKA